MIFAQSDPMIRPAIAALSNRDFTFHVIFFIVFSFRAIALCF
jgi:hypothetical protein